MNRPTDNALRLPMAVLVISITLIFADGTSSSSSSPFRLASSHGVAHHPLYYGTRMRSTRASRTSRCINRRGTATNGWLLSEKERDYYGRADSSDDGGGGDDGCSDAASSRYGGGLDEVWQCSSVNIGKTLLRGAFLRITSDLSGGTVFESIKTRVTTTREGPIEATRNIVKNGGVLNLWTGTQSRIIEGALVGAVFMLASTLTKAQVKLVGGNPTAAALAGGLVGGVAQAVVMTPAGMIFTSLNYNKDRPGHENDNVVSVTKRIVKERGIVGMYYGGGPMALRQATNWASRAGLTEIARTTLGMSQWGVLGEIGSGILGGLGSCWNTPIEGVRIITQRDLSSGKQTKTITGYWKEIVERDGFPGLFRGITPRALQAIWQTCFLVVVPNMMGI